MDSYRIEKDSMGDVKVPMSALYGAQTQRAVENFRISGLRFSRSFIRALCLVKLAAARVNLELGLLDEKKSMAIAKAAQEIVEGQHYDQFVLDVFQTGSGTSTNMNANEVIANRAIEILGGKRGEKGIIHPNDHVNMAQSTNDVFPTAIHIAALEAIQNDLLPSLEILEKSLNDKSDEFKEVIKAGRTHLQDAVPLTLGQEFSGYASILTHAINRVKSSLKSLEELPIGGTALGTGLNAHPRYAELMVKEISRITGKTFRRADNLFEAMQNKDATLEISGSLKTIAAGLMKISNDLRLLYSGPRTGFYEIDLPALQPGSSIMPGKINPVIPEAVNMVSARVLGNDLTIAISDMNGNLDLNVMMPIIAYSILESIEILASACKIFAEKCVNGITAKVDRCKKYAEDTVALITVVAPVIGYDKAARIAKTAMESGASIRQLIIDEKIIPSSKVDELLNLKKITEGGRT